MNPGRFFIPGMGNNITPMMGGNFLLSRGRLGLFGRITNSFKTFNWGGLLNGANKTLNVVNQTIPLVRQAGPMFNNMKSMLRLAKVFGNETNNSLINNDITNKNSSIINSSSKVINMQDKNLIQKKEISNYSNPNFFI